MAPALSFIRKEGEKGKIDGQTEKGGKHTQELE
jgi:hypothetical protein